MKVLVDVQPSREQLKLFVPDPQVMIIKGAAGSGKTTTCLLRLRIVLARMSGLKKRSGDSTPVKAHVFTYNRTLMGYVNQLAESQKKHFAGADVQISTFGEWVYRALCVRQNQICEQWKDKYLSSGFAKFTQDDVFLASELEYVLGRFPHDKLLEYIDLERTGRGKTPRFDKGQREKFLKDVVEPYFTAKRSKNELDFHDLAYRMSKLSAPQKYDVIVIDEGQDFSANELRAVKNVLNEEHSLTIVIDSAQKIYAKSFSWKEVGIRATPENVFVLKENFRNTKEIAEFIVPIIRGADLGGDFGALPAPENCMRSGQKPIVLEGLYSQQLNWVFENIVSKIDLTKETIAFLHPKGLFGEVIKRLNKSRIRYVVLTKQKIWPDDDINIGLITMHSSKGLEFDHVVIIGLNQSMTPHGKDDGDVFLDHYRRLLAMSCGRARNSLTVGYKPVEKSSLVDYFDPRTYSKVVL